MNLTKCFDELVNQIKMERIDYNKERRDNDYYREARRQNHYSYNYDDDDEDMDDVEVDDED